MGIDSFVGLKRPRRGVNHPLTSSAEGEERVGLYLYSPFGRSWPVLHWPLPLPRWTWGSTGEAWLQMKLNTEKKNSLQIWRRTGKTWLHIKGRTRGAWLQIWGRKRDTWRHIRSRLESGTLRIRSRSTSYWTATFGPACKKNSGCRLHYET